MHCHAHFGVEGESQVRFFDGNFTEYEADRHKRLGLEADRPTGSSIGSEKKLSFFLRILMPAHISLYKQWRWDLIVLGAVVLLLGGATVSSSTYFVHIDTSPKLCGFGVRPWLF